MMLTPNAAPSTSLTVSETPSTVIDPLEAMKRASSGGARKPKRRLAPSGLRSRISPTPSTWPATMWPPSSSPSFRGRSRLTGLPGRQAPMVVRDRVSAEASTANQPGSLSTTERQTPLQAMEAPWAIEALSYLVSMTIRVAPPGARLRTRPRSVMMPVNMGRKLPGPAISFQAVGTERDRAFGRQRLYLGEMLQPEGLRRRQAIAPDHARRAEDGETVHQLPAEQCRGKPGAALRQDPGQSPFPQQRKHIFQVQRPVRPGRRIDDLDAAIDKGAPAQPVAAFQRDQQCGRLPGAGHQRRGKRQAHAPVENDAKRRPVAKPRQPHVQQGIV